MSITWTTRELEGIALFLKELESNPKYLAEDSRWMCCHERRLFTVPLGDFTRDEWAALGMKLNNAGLTERKRDYTWKVHDGRLRYILKQETVEVRLKKSAARQLFFFMEGHPEEHFQEAQDAIKRALER